MGQIRIKNRPQKAGVYFMSLKLGVKVSEHQIRQGLSQWLYQGKSTQQSDALYGMFFLRGKAISAQEFKQDFERIWNERKTNGLTFQRGEAKLTGSSDKIESISLFIWLKKDIPPPPGLTGPIDTVINDITGQVEYEIDSQGRKYVPPRTLGALPAIPAIVKGLWWILGGILVSLMAWFSYRVITQMIILPIGLAIKAAADRAKKIVSSPIGFPVVAFSALALYLLVPKKSTEVQYR
jgi:hypothetical protein